MLTAVEDKLLSIPEIAKMFSRAVGSVERWRRLGELPAPDETLGRTPGWRRSTLLRWGVQTGKLGPDGVPIKTKPQRSVDEPR